MRSLLFLGAFVLLALGIFFARDRVKRACQIGAVLYAVVLVVRLMLFGFQDSDNVLNMLAVASVFLVIWLIGWAATRAVLEYRARSVRPPR